MNIFTLSISCGMSMSMAKARKRITRMNATRLDSFSCVFSFLTLQNNVLPMSLDSGLTMNAITQPMMTVLKKPMNVIRAPQTPWKWLRTT